MQLVVAVELSCSRDLQWSIRAAHKGQQRMVGLSLESNGLQPGLFMYLVTEIAGIAYSHWSLDGVGIVPYQQVSLGSVF